MILTKGTRMIGERMRKWSAIKMEKDDPARVDETSLKGGIEAEVSNWAIPDAEWGVGPKTDSNEVAQESTMEVLGKEEKTSGQNVAFQEKTTCDKQGVKAIPTNSSQTSISNELGSKETEEGLRVFGESIGVKWKVVKDKGGRAIHAIGGMEVYEVSFVC
ncbi:hypothetical protein L6452_06711 [Arctium lappa]|uniref:Uncharacterized protein n=1 Tax=Arctium lappa TaxID=4217 RepID=A0ACB9EK95_ARCLA|nr:hypothetical protein L6452_06711 [Arctium lappa]